MENELLYQMQNAFPLVERPFEALAKELDSTEFEVLQMVMRLKETKIIRQTSAIFDTKRLGYTSSLVAFKVKEPLIDRAAKIINDHPGVSHNYLRNHEYNIWFTIAVAPDSLLGLEKTIELLKKATKADAAIILPTLKMFKIAVKMDTTGKAAKKEKVAKISHKEIDLSPLHIDIIKALQNDIEVTPEPFKKTIQNLGISYETFFNITQELKESGVLRRFASILNHRNAGFTANAMSVWSVPEDKAEEIGRSIASFSAVSHCYLRPSYSHWPYNLFAMVHAKTEDETNAIIEEIARENNLDEYKKLYSTQEFKKQRLNYFNPAFEEWEGSVVKTVRI
ncbi:MAG: Lrp/AsnC family transcriptional regulator [Epsilonproteobacteria bacterium]|nr:Lrp/AsnC family transcriptional regulator [Campylobacterota bacterium]